MKKVYIAGSTGNLGSVIKRQLQKKKKYHVFSKRIDLTSLKKTFQYLSKIKPDYIINCAGLASIELCEKRKNLAKNLNINIPKNLFYYTKKNNIKLIHISTDHIYNSKNKKKNTEKNFKILNFYAKTKYEGEKKISNNKNTLIIRTNFFGKCKKNNTLVDWLLSTNKKKIQLYNNIFFSPLHISSLAKIIIKIITSKKAGIFNIGSRNGISKSDFLEKIIKNKKLNLKYIICKYKNKNWKRPNYMSMNINKFEKNFNIKLPHIEKEIKKI